MMSVSSVVSCSPLAFFRSSTGVSAGWITSSELVPLNSSLSYGSISLNECSVFISTCVHIASACFQCMLGIVRPSVIVCPLSTVDSDVLASCIAQDHLHSKCKCKVLKGGV